MKSILIMAAFALVMSVSPASAEDFKYITSEELKGMMDKGAKLIVIDVRTRAEFRQGHIPKAINIDPDQYSFIKKFLPKDKKKLLVFYCRGWG